MSITAREVALDLAILSLIDFDVTLNTFIGLNSDTFTKPRGMVMDYVIKYKMCGFVFIGEHLFYACGLIFLIGCVTIKVNMAYFTNTCHAAFRATAATRVLTGCFYLVYDFIIDPWNFYLKVSF